MTESEKSPFKVTRLYRHLERITEIAMVMAKFGFGDLFSSTGLRDVFLRARKLVGLPQGALPASRPRRLRMAFEELGTVFIKLGQYLSTRQDIIPFEYMEEFRLLQDKAPTVGFAEIRKILDGELSPGALLSIEEEPLASASVGQVHGAALPDGREVVVKVRRPGVERQARTDLEIIAILAHQIQRLFSGQSLIRPADLAAEFRRSLLTELNYRQEASNILRFRRLYAHSKSVRIPELIRTLTTDNIIVMERLRGVRFDDKEGLRRAGVDPRRLARATAAAALEQIMTFGFFHADPHPGNLFAQPGPLVAFMDFGLVGTLDHEKRDDLLKLAIGAVRQDAAKCARAVLRLTSSDARPNRDLLETDLSALIDNHLQGSLRDINIQRFVNDIIELMTQHSLRVPNDLLLLAKAIIQFEGLGELLDDNFSITADAGPAVRRLYQKRFTPSYWTRLLRRRAEDAAFALENLPRDAAPLLNALKSGKVRADVTLERLPTLNSAVYRSSSRVSLALIISAMILGSAHILVGNNPPYWRGMPVIGLMGLAGAFVLTVWLFIDHLRSPRL